jgi:hypothetical protein
MKHWTTEARERLEEYLHERAARETWHGAEGATSGTALREQILVAADRANAGNAGIFGVAQLDAVLAGIDPAYRPAPRQVALAPVKPGGAFARFLMWTFGVVFPAGVLLFESVASFCGAVFFDPIPSGWHFLWIALVPAVNGWLLWGAGRAAAGHRGIAAGFIAVTAWFYALLFFPLIHLSVIALLFIGMGMLSLTPVLAGFATWRIGRRARLDSGDPEAFGAGWRQGLAAGLVALILLEGPALWTRANLVAALGDGKGSVSALARLRTWHSERTLLKACYEGNRGTQIATDVSGWMFKGWRIPLGMMGGSISDHDSDKARNVFFRVTGKPFNSVKPPDSSRGGGLMGRADPMEDFEFDSHLGGDDVAVRLKQLDLSESRFDGHVDPVSQIGYGEWTMVFDNRSGTPKEARCQVRLPRSGRVSRLTLWVNGEPREAAFNTIAKVKAAYQSVAVVQRLDPVLVNMVGLDTVMVQCFPVPAHGSMKIRFGVTAPLDGGRWELPYLIERNFGIAGGLEHALWLQAGGGFDLTGFGGDLAGTRDGGHHALRHSLDESAPVTPGLAMRLTPPAVDLEAVWCEDPFAEVDERVLIGKPAWRKVEPKGRPVVVIDGSASMKDCRKWLLKSLRGIPAGEIDLILADDGARRVSPADLERYRFSGGRDNEAALREAIRISRKSGGPVVWIHGPQAVGVAQAEALVQIIESGPVGPVIHDVEAVSGPNRFAEALFKTGCLRRGPALVEPASDLSAFLQRLLHGGEEPTWHWRRAPAGVVPEGRKVSDQLARFWAAQRAEDPAASLPDAARAALAARYQLVTAYSGAVVLETMEQFHAHGLEPVDGDATPRIPGVPEPSSSLLFLIAATAAMMRRKR